MNIAAAPAAGGAQIAGQRGALHASSRQFHFCPIANDAFRYAGMAGRRHQARPDCDVSCHVASSGLASKHPIPASFARCHRLSAAQPCFLPSCARTLDSPSRNAPFPAEQVRCGADGSVWHGRGAMRQCGGTAEAGSAACAGSSGGWLAMAQESPRFQNVAVAAIGLAGDAQRGRPPPLATRPWLTDPLPRTAAPQLAPADRQQHDAGSEHRAQQQGCRRNGAPRPPLRCEGGCTRHRRLHGGRHPALRSLVWRQPAHPAQRHGKTAVAGGWAQWAWAVPPLTMGRRMPALGAHAAQICALPCFCRRLPTAIHRRPVCR